MTDIRLTQVRAWYDANARTIIWRNPHTSPWGILLSEVMSQQTQVARVEPIWANWMRRWPTPGSFAAASPADILQAWGSLGYPRRALRLHSCAQEIVAHHHGEVPDTLEQLLALPGIGTYTAAAVAAFAYGQRVPVIDTNVRRVLSRAFHGEFHPGGPSKKELEFLEQLLPTDDAPTTNVALMELGALVCTNRRPACARCPLQSSCAWVAKGEPEPAPLQPKQARFAGSDRQVRGKILKALRAQPQLPRTELDALWEDSTQLERALASLLADGLVEQQRLGVISLPGFEVNGASEGPGIIGEHTGHSESGGDR
ncbi:MAG: A/G-specific adenine glycosylase [Corynebacterium sp.]|nr:A/G-specific adenine glycosylase [Corynebacterium sp.]